MKPDSYSPLKFAAYTDHIAAIRRGEATPPVHVQLILSDLCNQDCNFCAYRMSGYTSNQLFNEGDNHNPNRKIPVERVMKLIDEMAEIGVEAVQLTGGGEPTVHPHFDEILEKLLTTGFKVGLVTNGVKLSARAIELLTCFPATWVRVSLDAASEKLYGAIRGVPGWHLVSAVKNLSRLSSGRPNRPGPKLTVGAGFVVTKDNWHEVLACARLVKESGADNLRISAIFQSEGAEYFKLWGEDAARLCKEAEGLSDERFTVVNMFGDRVDDLVLGSPDYPVCWYQHFTTYIGADQSLYRCCVYSYNERGRIGSIKDQTFAEAWFSKSRVEDFKKFDPKMCQQCQFNEKNRIMHSVLRQDQSPHQAFI